MTGSRGLLRALGDLHFHQQTGVHVSFLQLCVKSLYELQVGRDLGQQLPSVLRASDAYFDLPDTSGYSYSLRSAVIGSIWQARRAGTYAATNATARRTAAEKVMEPGSFAEMANSIVAMNREAASAAGMPTAQPASTSHITWPRISRSTFLRSAPNAIRIPISEVRRTTL